MGAFQRVWWWGLLAAIGIVLGAAYMLWLYQRVFFGPLDQSGEQGPEGSERPRDPLPRADRHPLLLDRPLSEAVLRVIEKPVDYVVAKVDPDIRRGRGLVRIRAGSGRGGGRVGPC